MSQFKKIAAILFLCGSLFFITACSKNSIDNIKPNQDPTINDKYEKDEQYQIYELAIKEGKFTGTYEQWLASIKGENGKPGENGKSAYELYKQLHPEYTGSLQQWFESLKGKDGLNGQDGVDGKSAYELYKEAYPEYTGTLEEWLESLKGQVGQDGKDGVDGKSAYELYLESHPEYNKTEKEWIDDLINDKLGKKELHTIIFDSNGGTDVENLLVKHLGKIKKPKNPTKEGSVFDGWYVDDEKWVFSGYSVTDDITLVAHWSNVIDICFDTQCDFYIEPQKTKINSYVVDLPIPINNGYRFLGWYDSDTNQQIELPYKYSNNQNLNLYAKWEFLYEYKNDDNGGVKITKYLGDEINVIVPDEINGMKVTSIDNFAFTGLYNVTNIKISNSVKTIEGYAFTNCFDLMNIEIPNSVINLKTWAINGCQKLRSINIPSSVTNIEMNAITSCGSIEKITVSEQNEIYDSRNDCNAIIETKTNTLIHGCNTTIIPFGVLSIGNAAFDSCSNLNNIVIPTSVKIIEPYAFSHCKLLKVEIPNSVTSIGDSAFNSCTRLTSVEISASVTSIGDSAFSFCKNLNSIQVNEQNIVYDSRNDCNAIIETKTNTLIQGCNNSVIPTGVTSIGDSAFSYCIDLTYVEIPNSVISIGSEAFYECSSLINIEIPDSVISVGYQAFYKCSNLSISCEVQSQPSTWDTNWNPDNRPVLWGYKKQQMQ